MYLKLLVIIAFVGLNACSADGNRRRRPSDSGTVAGITADELASFDRLVRTLDVEKLDIKPSNGDKIEYLATYLEPQIESFTIEADGPFKGKECRYRYEQMIINETLIVEEGKGLTGSSVTTTPFEPKLITFGDNTPFAKECEKEKASLNKTVDKEVTLEGRLEEYKTALITNTLSLIEICRLKKELREGRCESVKVNQLKREAADNFSGSRFVFNVGIESAQGTRDFLSVFSVEFAHFYMGGMIYQEGESGVLAAGNLGLSGLELRCVNDTCP